MQHVNRHAEVLLAQYRSVTEAVEGGKTDPMMFEFMVRNSAHPKGDEWPVPLPRRQGPGWAATQGAGREGGVAAREGRRQGGRATPGHAAADGRAYAAVGTWAAGARPAKPAVLAPPVAAAAPPPRAAGWPMDHEEVEIRAITRK